MAKDYAYLMKVNALSNQNRFYKITENEDGSLDVQWGRVGAKTFEKHYLPQEYTFNQLLNEKLKEDYQPVTALHIAETKQTGLQEALSYKPIEDEQVQELMNLLITSSREFMKNNYEITPADITDKMISEAEADINKLISIATEKGWSNQLYEFNKTLQEDVFMDIPRKMDKVEDYIAKTEEDMSGIIERELDMLDNIIRIREQEKSEQSVTQNSDKTFLEAHGLKIRPVTYKEEDQITTHLGRDYEGLSVERRYVRGFTVENERTRANYEQYKASKGMTPRDVRLFYHGSKVENWQSIISQGMLLNPDAKVTGKMFGQGLYFASETRKALNYMDTAGSHWNKEAKRDTGYTAVYAVALGKCYEPSYILGSSFTEKNLPNGCNSVYASKYNRALELKNDEYIVYNQNACTIKYLLEMSSKYAPEIQFNLNRDLLRNQLEAGFSSLEKTPLGLKAELSLELLNTNVMKEISDKIIKSADCDRFYINYNAKSDTITFEAKNTFGDSVVLSPAITKHDFAFIAREMKKAFVECENDWKALVKASSDYAIGKTVANKEGMVEQDNQSSKEKKIVKE